MLDIAGPNNTRIPRWPLAAARIYLGVVFAVAGVRQLVAAPPWVKPGQSWPAAAHDQLVEWSAHTPGWYQATLAHFIEHTDRMAGYVAIIHIVLGLALIAGVFTRTVGVISFVLLCNYMAAAGTSPFSPGPTTAFAALALVVTLGNAGMVWGLDGAARNPSPTMPP